MEAVDHMAMIKDEQTQKMSKMRLVNYQIFEEEFWNLKVARSHKAKKLKPTVFWNEVRTRYKGNPEYYKGVFLNKNENNRKFSLEKLKKIRSYTTSSNIQSDDSGVEVANREIFFGIFAQYQKWLEENNYFDLEDMVGSLIQKKEEKWGSSSVMFNYMIVDEIQDISYNSLELIAKFSSIRMTLCGDSAQNVGRGQSLKFKDVYRTLEYDILAKRKEASFEGFEEF